MVAEVVKSRSGEIQRLCERFGVRRLELFGSAAAGGFDADRSDLDFLVEFGAMNPRTHTDAYFGLSFGLRDLFGREIDLVEMEGVGNPYIRAAIEQTRTPIYVAA